jgi:hypothetical protein
MAAAGILQWCHSCALQWHYKSFSIDSHPTESRDCYINLSMKQLAVFLWGPKSKLSCKNLPPITHFPVRATTSLEPWDLHMEIFPQGVMYSLRQPAKCRYWTSFVTCGILKQIPTDMSVWAWLRTWTIIPNQEYCLQDWCVIDLDARRTDWTHDQKCILLTWYKSSGHTNTGSLLSTAIP